MALILLLTLFTALVWIAPARAAGGLDQTFHNPAVSRMPIVKGKVDYPDGRALIYGNFAYWLNGIGNTMKYSIARLNADGSVDSGFNPAVGWPIDIRSVCLLSSGKILIGGEFTASVTTDTGTIYYRNIAQLNSDGSLDTSFFNNPMSWLGKVNAIAVQSNGKILVGGWGLQVSGDGTNVYHLLRLQADGTLDPTYPMRSAPEGVVQTIEILNDDPFNPDRARIYGSLPNTANLNNDYLLVLYSNGNRQWSLGDETVNGPIFAMVTQPDGKLVIGGQFTQVLGASANRVARLNNDLSLDSSFAANLGSGAAGGRVSSLVLQGDGRIVVAGNFTSFSGSGCGFLCRLNSNGTPDSGFNAGTGANDRIFSMTASGNGFFIYGAFYQYNGSSRNGIAALNGDGSLASQNASFPNAIWFVGVPVYAQAVQADGKILVGGDFTGAGSKFHNGLARLNPDGSTDNSFRAGVDGLVRSIAVQPDGKILVAGLFGSTNGYGRTSVARLNANGSLDLAFNPIVTNNGMASELWQVVRLSTGQIMIAGALAAVNGSPFNGLVRLNSTGLPDYSFTPPIGLNGGAIINVSSLADTAGEYLVGGSGIIQGQFRGFLMRLSNNGTLDTTFGPTDPSTPSANAIIFNNSVNCLLLQPDNCVAVGGNFTQIMDGSQSPPLRAYLARFTANGALDSSFTTNPGANNSIYTMALQPDGKTLIGGNFTTYDSSARNRIARVNPNGSLDRSFMPGIGTTGTVYTILPPIKNKALVGGAFVSYNNIYRWSVARIFTSSSSPGAALLLLLSE